MGSASGIAASGLQAAALALDVSANNVANALTEGFVPSHVAPADLDGGGVVGNVVKDPDPMAEVRADRALLTPSRTDLIQEMVTQARAAAVYRANLATLRADQEMESLVDALKPR
jgi:flagellar basal body rod protein FlgC